MHFTLIYSYNGALRMASDQTHLILLKIQEEFEVVWVQGGTHDHAAETVGGRFVVAEQIQEADTKRGEVLGGIARTGAAGVFAENDV